MTYSSDFFTFLRTNSNLDLKTLEPFFRIEASYLEKLNHYPELLEQLKVQLQKEKPFFTLSDEAKQKETRIEQCIKKIEDLQAKISKFINSSGLRPIFDKKVPSLFLNFFKSDFHQKLSHICEQLSDFYRNENFNRLFESPEEIEVLQEFTTFGALTASYLVNFDSLSKILKDKRESFTNEEDEKVPWNDEPKPSLSPVSDDSSGTTISEAPDILFEQQSSSSSISIDSINTNSLDTTIPEAPVILPEQQSSSSSTSIDSINTNSLDTTIPEAPVILPEQQSSSSSISIDSINSNSLDTTIPEEPDIHEEHPSSSIDTINIRPLHRPNAQLTRRFEIKKNLEQYQKEIRFKEQKKMLAAIFKNHHQKSSNIVNLSGILITSEVLYLHAKAMEKTSSNKKSTNLDYIHLYIENERKGHIASCFHLMNIALAGGFSLQDREKSIRWALDLLITYKEYSSMLLFSLKAEDRETIRKLIALIENRPKRLKSNLDLTQLHPLTKEKFNQLVKDYLTMLEPIKPRTNIKFDIWGTNVVFTGKIWQSQKHNQQLEELSNSHDSKFSKLAGKVKILLEELIKNYKEKTWLVSYAGSTKKDQLIKIYHTLLESRILDEDIPCLLSTIEDVCSIHRNILGLSLFSTSSLQEFHKLKHFLKIDDEITKPSINQKYKKMPWADEKHPSSSSSSSSSSSVNFKGMLIPNAPDIQQRSLASAAISPLHKEQLTSEQFPNEIKFEEQNQKLKELSIPHNSQFSVLEVKVIILLKEIIESYEEKTWLSSCAGSAKKEQLIEIYNTLLKSRYLDKDIPRLLSTIEDVCSIQRNIYGFNFFSPRSLQEFNKWKNILKIDETTKLALA